MTEISIVPFKAKYYEQLLELHKSQNYLNIDQIQVKTLPKIGFIAFLGEQPVAAGFLRRLEPCYAQIDTLVSSAYFGSAIRHQALVQVVDNLLIEAKLMKLQGLIALTSDEGILKRAETYGFHIVPSTVIGRKL